MAGRSQKNEHPDDSAGSDSTDGPDSTEGPREDSSPGETGSAALDCVDESVDEGHLEDLPDGSGCVEVWEYLADRRGDPE